MRLIISLVVNLPGGCPRPMHEPRGVRQWEAYLTGYMQFADSTERRVGLEELAYLLECVSHANGSLTDVLNVGGDQTLVTARFSSVADVERFKEAFESQYAL